jgi:hypothetical protein
MGRQDFSGGFRFYFNIIMVMIYAAAGVLLILNSHTDLLPSKNIILIGIVLLLYAAYRSYKLIGERKKMLDENNSDDAQ